LIGESVFTTHGPVWERQRRMLDPAFAQAKLKDVFLLMRKGADSMLTRLDRVKDGEEIDIEMEMTHVTADIILRTILSEALEGDVARRIFDGFNLFQEKASTMIIVGLCPVPMWILPFHYFSWKRAGREIRELLAVPIRKRYEAFHQGQTGDYKDILQSLLESVDPVEDSVYTLEELIDQVAVLFLAGHETSASALSWSLFLLAKCPEIQEELHGETVSILGDRSPDFKDIPRHKKIRNVFRETMRLYPPVGFLIFRKAKGEQKTSKGKTIPDGSSVAVSPWLVHRHRELWDKPNEFNPSRFDGGLDQPSCAYIPFGQGPRICIGAGFAMQEAMLILASLTRRYRFEPGAGPDPEPVSRLTIRSKDGISLQLYRRAEPSEPRVPCTEDSEEAPSGISEPKCPFH
jgi:cytochrome P450